MELRKRKCPQCAQRLFDTGRQMAGGIQTKCHRCKSLINFSFKNGEIVKVEIVPRVAELGSSKIS